MRSWHFATSWSRVIGLSTVPRTAPILAQIRAVGERDPPGAAAHRRHLDRRAPRGAPSPADAGSDGILHSRLVVDRPKGGRPVDQHQRHRELDVDIRRVAVVHHGSGAERTRIRCT